MHTVGKDWGQGWATTFGNCNGSAASPAASPTRAALRPVLPEVRTLLQEEVAAHRQDGSGAVRTRIRSSAQQSCYEGGNHEDTTAPGHTAGLASVGTQYATRALGLTHTTRHFLLPEALSRQGRFDRPCLQRHPGRRTPVPARGRAAGGRRARSPAPPPAAPASHSHCAPASRPAGCSAASPPWGSPGPAQAAALTAAAVAGVPGLACRTCRGSQTPPLRAREGHAPREPLPQGLPNQQHPPPWIRPHPPKGRSRPR